MSAGISEMSREDLQKLIEETVWKALNQILRDPDFDLKLNDRLLQRLKVEEAFSEEELISASDLAAELELDW